jgi:hypothetical protein
MVGRRAHKRMHGIGGQYPYWCVQSTRLYSRDANKSSGVPTIALLLAFPVGLFFSRFQTRDLHSRVTFKVGNKKIRATLFYAYDANTTHNTFTPEDRVVALNCQGVPRALLL